MLYLWALCYRERKDMAQVVRIQGKAEKVFDAVKNICRRHPYMTLAEAGHKGLLEPKLLRTVPYELGKFPEVKLNSGIEDN
jgi:hypothetical protein